eukprot:g257.t1
MSSTGKSRRRRKKGDVFGNVLRRGKRRKKKGDVLGKNTKHAKAIAHSNLSRRASLTQSRANPFLGELFVSKEPDEFVRARERIATITTAVLEEEKKWTRMIEALKTIGKRWMQSLFSGLSLAEESSSMKSVEETSSAALDSNDVIIIDVKDEIEEKQDEVEEYEV